MHLAGSITRGYRAWSARSSSGPPATLHVRWLTSTTRSVERGLAEAACLTERLYVRDVRVFGADCLPAGPCLFLANHPGMTDTLALFTALARPDLRVIALDRPFLLSLPNLSRQLYYVTDSPQERVSLVRRVRPSSEVWRLGPHFSRRP